MDFVRTNASLLCDLVTFIWLLMRPHSALAAENLLLRKQLAMYQERKLKARRPDPAFQSHHTNIGTLLLTTSRSQATLFSVDYTMNIAWYRRLLEFLQGTSGER